MLFNIYLISCIMSNLAVSLFAKACYDRAKREGYKSVKKDISLFKKIIKETFSVLILSIPIINVLAVLRLFTENWDELYNECKSDLIKKGLLVPNEELKEKTVEMDNKQDIRSNEKKVNSPFIRQSFYDLESRDLETLFNSRYVEYSVKVKNGEQALIIDCDERISEEKKTSLEDVKDRTSITVNFPGRSYVKKL